VGDRNIQQEAGKARHWIIERCEFIKFQSNCHSVSIVQKSRAIRRQNRANAWKMLPAQPVDATPSNQLIG
jgi:hypothetical protein